jgi:hypothetical protein
LYPEIESMTQTARERGQARCARQIWMFGAWQAAEKDP